MNLKLRTEAPARRSRPVRATSGRSSKALERVQRNCVEACVLCESECRRTLDSEPIYTGGAGPVSAVLIGLMACAVACRAAVSAVLRSDPHSGDIAASCAELCIALATGPHSSTRERAALVAVAEQCHGCCTDFFNAHLVLRRRRSGLAITTAVSGN